MLLISSRLNLQRACVCIIHSLKLGLEILCEFLWSHPCSWCWAWTISVCFTVALQWWVLDGHHCRGCQIIILFLLYSSLVKETVNLRTSTTLRTALGGLPVVWIKVKHSQNTFFVLSVGLMYSSPRPLWLTLNFSVVTYLHLWQWKPDCADENRSNTMQQPRSRPGRKN